MNNGWKFIKKVTNCSQNTLFEAKSWCYNSCTFFLWVIIWMKIKYPSEQSLRCIESIWMSVWWSFRATISRSLYHVSAFWCLHNSDTTSRFFIYYRSCGLKLLYPVLDGVAIRNLYMSPSYKMFSEYHWVAVAVSLLFENVLMADTQSTSYQWSMFLLNGILGWML